MGFHSEVAVAVSVLLLPTQLFQQGERRLASFRANQLKSSAHRAAQGASWSIPRECNERCTSGQGFGSSSLSPWVPGTSKAPSVAALRLQDFFPLSLLLCFSSPFPYKAKAEPCALLRAQTLWDLSEPPALPSGLQWGKEPTAPAFLPGRDFPIPAAFLLPMSEGTNRLRNGGGCSLTPAVCWVGFVQLFPVLLSWEERVVSLETPRSQGSCVNVCISKSNLKKKIITQETFLDWFNVR